MYVCRSSNNYISFQSECSSLHGFYLTLKFFKLTLRYLTQSSDEQAAALLLLFWLPYPPAINNDLACHLTHLMLKVLYLTLPLGFSLSTLLCLTRLATFTTCGV